jgi:DNA polymerase-3 subunit alpha
MRTIPKINFVNLHCHDSFSVNDGLGFPEEFMRFAYKNGMDAIAISNHGNMNSLVYQINAYKKMKDEGKIVKPIFAVEAYFVPSIASWKQDYEKYIGEKKKNEEDLVSSGIVINEDDLDRGVDKSVLNTRSHLLLIAKNQTGLNNLFSLISKSYQVGNFYRYPRVDFELLKKYSEGVIASSACIGGVLGHQYYRFKEFGEDVVLSKMKEINSKFKKIFGKDWYLELQWNNIPEQHIINHFLLQLALEEGVELISTADAHYSSPDLWLSRIVYKKLGWLNSKEQDFTLPGSVEETGYHLYPKNGDEMYEEFLKHSTKYTEHERELVLRSIENTAKISQEKIECFIPENKIKLPSFVLPKGRDENEYLAEMARNGLKEKGLEKNKEYSERLERELKTIKQKSFSLYFITMKTVSDIAKKVMLCGPGRGSAAGSLVVYCLNITEIDPIKYNLQFERFLSKDSEGYPDIDFDVSDPVKLKEILTELWGENSVVLISNFNTLQLKSLIKDISKFYKIPFFEVNSVTSKMIHEATPEAKKVNGIKAGIYVPTFEEVMEYSGSLKKFLLKYPHVAVHVKNLQGQIRSVGRHAGGVLISENIDKNMPLISSGGIIQTPWCEGQHVRHLEPMGFIKFDLLGLSTLQMMEKTIKNILIKKEKREITFEDIKSFYYERLCPGKINLSDQRVWKTVFRNVDKMSAGVFQASGNGFQKFCKTAKPENIKEFSALTSIYRPGPLSGGVEKTYVNAKNGLTKIKYEHPILESILKENYGHIIFQEDLALIAHKLGKNISLDDGNKLRKILTKKGTEKTEKVKKELYEKFLEGCKEKGMRVEIAENLWKKMEFFSSYGFNLSHAVSYSLISFQCAWLLTYHPSDWVVSFLDKEPENKKEHAVGVAKTLEYKIKLVDVNESPAYEWEVSDKEDKILLQPLSAIKGLGEAAINQILLHRPFNNIEDFLFNKEVSYSKLNKGRIDVLIRSGALNSLIDKRFNGEKHFWTAVAVERPKTEKDLRQNIEMFKNEGDFTKDEKIDYITNLTGFFPIELVVGEEQLKKLEKVCIPPISKYDDELKMAWFIPREVVVKRTKNNKEFYIVTATDNLGAQKKIKFWGVNSSRDKVPINKLCIANLENSEMWGFCVKQLTKNFRIC